MAKLQNKFINKIAWHRTNAQYPWTLNVLGNRSVLISACIIHFERGHPDLCQQIRNCTCSELYKALVRNSFWQDLSDELDGEKKNWSRFGYDISLINLFKSAVPIYLSLVWWYDLTATASFLLPSCRNSSLVVLVTGVLGFFSVFWLLGINVKSELFTSDAWRWLPVCSRRL